MTSAVEEKAIELLQNLGLKEYEARCFTALTRLPSGTAREISETSDVPRTRVYEAVRVLESQGLVEVHQGNPQYFRAVGVDEAVTVLANRTRPASTSWTRRFTVSEVEWEATTEMHTRSGPSPVRPRSRRVRTR